MYLWCSDAQFINLTPHDINMIFPDGTTKTYPKSGNVARVIYDTTETGRIDEYPVVTGTYNHIEGLPAPQTNVTYIVSMETRLAAQKYQNRNDLVTPDTSPKNAVRDASGNIVGAKQWVI